MISPPPGATLTDTRVPYTTLCRSGDSGKVSGAGFSARPDRDLKIAAQTPYWWAVMLWSDDGKASTWSAPERFITGVTEGWQATWIAADKGWPVHIAESRKGADNPGRSAERRVGKESVRVELGVRRISKKKNKKKKH